MRGKGRCRRAVTVLAMLLCAAGAHADSWQYGKMVGLVGEQQDGAVMTSLRNSDSNECVYGLFLVAADNPSKRDFFNLLVVAKTLLLPVNISYNLIVSGNSSQCLISGVFLAD